MSWLAYQRPHIGRVVVAIAYALASVGLLIVAFDHILVDQWAICGAAIGTLILLGLILWTGHGSLWLGVGGVWIYAAVMELLRGPTRQDRIGIGLVFISFAFGALGAYTAYRREAPLRI